MTSPPPAAPLTLFDAIERLQADLAWGSVLDAGTGVKSAGWIAGLPTARWTLVSADPSYLDETARAVADRRRPDDRVLLGNWTDPGLLAGETFDTVLADYLLGAVEGYAPYFQENLFARLRPMVGRRLYVIGIDPYVVGEPPNTVGRLVQEIGRFRDGSCLLAGHTPYREYPAEWVLERLERLGLRILFARRFPNRYDLRWVDRQFADARLLIDAIPDRSLAAALAAHMKALRERAADLCESEGGLAHGHDYLIAAEPA